MGVPKVGQSRRRQALATVLSILILCVFAVRLVDIQVVSGTETAAAALEGRLVTIELDVPRADILDRNGVVLATSIDRYHVKVNQQALAEWKVTDHGVVVAGGPYDAARLLSPLLGMSEQSLLEVLVGDKTFQYVAKNVPVETWEAIRKLRIGGIDGESTSERLYPNGTIAGNVIGFVGGREDREGVWGIAGLEYSYEDHLLGTPGTLTYERGGGGEQIPTGVREETPAIPGMSVVTTIDRDIQWKAQTAIDAQVSATRAEWGIVVVTNVCTGEVLALADSGTVDPNYPALTAVEDRGSRAVSAVFEPGSTAKIITMAAALEEGTATPTSQFIAPYKYTTPSGQEFRDSHWHADQRLTLAGVLAESSNTGTVMIGEKLSEAKRYEYLRAFGFGSKTGLGLPGESAGILRDADVGDPRTPFTVLFGQGLSVTAIQNNEVFSTVACGGMYHSATVVRGFEDSDGNFTPEDREEPRRVISESTAADLMLMLEAVVDEGTGTKAQIPGYRIAGKTGTAQAADGHGGMTSVVASFVGVAPADNPQIAVSVMLYNPQTSQWGGTVAGPVFKDVTTFALQSLRIPPSGDEAQLYPITWG